MGEGLEGRCRLEHPLNGLDSVLFIKLTKQIFLFNVFSGNLPGVWVKAGKFHHASHIEACKNTRTILIGNFIIFQYYNMQLLA